MKLFLFLLALICAQSTIAQVSIRGIESDPNRAGNASLANAREEGINDIDYLDALSLPFFEDFSSVGPSIESVITSESAVIIRTFQPHGFISPTEIVISQMKGQDTADYLNGRWYAKGIDKYQFQLYRDAATADPLLGKGRPVSDAKIGQYAIVGVNFGPNPDLFKWVNSNNIYVNNRFAINPPSIYTATFDGLDSRGERYVITATQGWGDTLTSRKIDLSSVKAKEDSAHLSFWWQPGGLLDMPDFADILKLEFKNRKGSWDVIKQIKGGQSVQMSKVFNYEVIKIDTSYFHNSFQFRFESFGRRDGAVDAWNIDYILLDKNRDTSRWATKEGSVVSLQTSALKEYSAMPINQFQATDLNNEVNLSIRNISNSPRTFNLPFSLSLNNSIVLETDLRSNAQPALSAKEFREIKSNINVSNVNIDNSAKVAVLKYSLAADFTDPTNQRINLLRNNNDSTFTILSDYFAYDDGTFEKLFELKAPSPLNQAVVVSKFSLKSPDRLDAVDADFPKVGANITAANQRLRIKVYADDNGKPGLALDNGKDTVRITQNPDNSKLETFQRYQLDYPLDLPAGTFYVGFQHEGTTTISYLGLDGNTAPIGKQFYKLTNAGPWVEDNGTNFGGAALMIRPVFKARNIDATTDSEKNSLTCEVFPNPSTGVIHIEGDVTVANLYDASGKLIQSSVYNFNESKTIGNSNLLPGFYFLHLENDHLKAVKKVVIIK
ncbi:MAG TPA: T9SS type A sorting domain-containing protein [Cytophagaceae bacterium]